MDGEKILNNCCIYSSEDIKNKQRISKYTPKWVFCLMTFYGQFVQTNTDIMSFEFVSQEQKWFRHD